MPALAVHCAGTSASVPIAADAAPSEVVMDVLADDPPKLEPSTFYQIPLLDVTKKKKKRGNNIFVITPSSWCQW
jgi:hypothetical protein